MVGNCWRKISSKIWSINLLSREALNVSHKSHFTRQHYLSEHALTQSSSVLFNLRETRDSKLATVRLARLELRRFLWLHYFSTHGGIEKLHVEFLYFSMVRLLQNDPNNCSNGLVNPTPWYCFFKLLFLFCDKTLVRFSFGISYKLIAKTISLVHFTEESTCSHIY